MDIGNYNLFEVVTPIKINKYARLLEDSGFDVEKSRFLVKGFQDGFDIGYRGPQFRRDTSRNIPISKAVGSESEMWEKLMKEVSVGRHSGPYLKIPFKNYMQSPIGLVPKAGNKTHLIFHLSYDFGRKGWTKKL